MECTRTVNPACTRDIDTFVRTLRATVHAPRSKRGHLNSVQVNGSLTTIPNSSPDVHYCFRATFLRTYRGMDNEFCTPYTFTDFRHSNANEFDAQETVCNNLCRVQERLRAIDPLLGEAATVYEKRTLIVPAAFALIEQRCGKSVDTYL